MAGKLESIMLAGRRVEYRVRFSAGGRKSRIRVGPAGVEVVLPQGARPSDAAAFIRKHATWVVEQITFFRRAGRHILRPRHGLPTTILFHGRSTHLTIVHDDFAKRSGGIEDLGHTLRVRLPNFEAIEPLKVLQGWLRKRAKEAIHARVAERSREMRRRPGRIYIMDQRTKWGGCSRRRNLSFNWRLVMAPPAVLDYIIVHELAHLAEPRHSAKFWLIVRSYSPSYPRQKEWLRQKQETLRSAI